MHRAKKIPNDLNIWPPHVACESSMEHCYLGIRYTIDTIVAVT